MAALPSSVAALSSTGLRCCCALRTKDPELLKPKDRFVHVKAIDTAYAATVLPRIEMILSGQPRAGCQRCISGGRGLTSIECPRALPRLVDASRRAATVSVVKMMRSTLSAALAVLQLAPVVRADCTPTKTFDLYTSTGLMSPVDAPGFKPRLVLQSSFDADATKGTVPGPEIRVTAGDCVQVNVHNNM